MSDTIQVQVHVDLDGATTRAGTAFFHWKGGGVTSSFTYAPDWLANSRSFALDPELPLDSGSHHVDKLPGSFSDCSPDRWGRNLIARRGRAEARRAEGAAPSLSDIDYLLGVSDLTRQGALRFRLDNSGPFVAPDNEIPKLIALPNLLRAAEAVARSSSNDDEYEAVKALLDAGSGSLGGARPKATVRGDGDQLLIAKFPHHHDDWDVSAWEKTALDIAEEAGIAVPPRQLVHLGSASVLLLERFDRGQDQARVPYISALTLMSGREGDTFDYEDLAVQLEESGAGDSAELGRLFRRVVLSVAIHNTDDHFRNTGFLRSSDGWRLSPVFDINPDPNPGQRRQSTIGGADSIDDAAEGLMHLAQWCRLDTAGARAVIQEVSAATGRWRRLAAANGLTATDITAFVEVFEATANSLDRVAGETYAVGAPTTEPSPSTVQGREPPGTLGGGQFR